jgi:hypothetical protein
MGIDIKTSNADFKTVGPRIKDEKIILLSQLEEARIEK